MRHRAGLMAGLLTLLLTAVAKAAPPPAAPLPAPLREASPRLLPLGSATLHWFGLHVYDASLFVEESPYSADGTAVLSIRYRLSFKHHRLVETTLKEWRRLEQGTAAQQEQWARRLDAMWPDVRSGDSLTAFKRHGGPTQFYFGDRLLGEIADPEFGPAFFAIWLNEKCRYPRLRDGLLGKE